MAHNVETARKYYHLQEKSKSSVQASRHLRQVMRGASGADGSNDQRNCLPTSNPSLTCLMMISPKLCEVLGPMKLKFY